MTKLARILASLRRGAGELSPSCREAARLQSEALDRLLTWRQKLGLRLHLLLCKWCRRYGRQLLFLRDAARRRDSHDSVLEPQKLKPEAINRMKNRLRSAEK